MDELNEVKNFPDISFINSETLESTREQVYQDAIDFYKKDTGKTLSLAKGDPTKLVLDTVALICHQMKEYIDAAGKEGLLKYTFGSYEDNVGAVRGVTRAGASYAITTLRFTLSAVQTGATAIPRGTQATNGEYYFTTDEYAEVPAGDTYIDVPATCTEEGEEANDIPAGTITTLVDPLPFVDNVKNITATSGGTDTESDDSLRERIYLAPAKYSVAGPKKAYIYWTKYFEPDVSDAMIPDDDTPQEVNIYVLLSGGRIPTADVLNKIKTGLQNNDIRPLNDKVNVLAPTTRSINIAATYYISESDLASVEAIKEAVSEAVESYKNWQSSKIGRDINPDKLRQLIMAAGAKRVEVTSPVYTTVKSEEVAIVAKTEITYGGLEDD